MKALFEVGEEVIIVSKDCPELNGDAVIISIAPVGVLIAHTAERNLIEMKELLTI